MIKLGLIHEKHRRIVNKNIENIKEKYNENDLKHMCCICLSNKISTICIPCGHACMCKNCSNGYNKKDACPICRKHIQNVFDMFMS